MTVVTANPGMPLTSPSESPQRHLLLGHKASVTLKTLLTQNSAVAATVKTKTPLPSVPASGMAHLPGRNVAVTMGQLCVPPRFQASRARPIPTSRAWHCACQALGAGSHPASPGSSHSPRSQYPWKNVTRACRRPGRPSGESGKAEDKFKALCNTSFQREVVARGQTVPLRQALFS